MKKYKNKYRISSIRAQWWDYAWQGAYFITISTYDKQHFFGEIVDSNSQLSPSGKIAHGYWQKIPDQFPYVELGNFIVMPNHIHGILILNDPVETRFIASQFIASHRSNTENQPTTEPPSNTNSPLSPPPKTGGITGNKNPMNSDNISRIIRWYKGRCTFEIRKIHADFAWQCRFYDHIIRNNKDYQRISEYINNNPSNWKDDKYNT